MFVLRPPPSSAAAPHGDAAVRRHRRLTAAPTSGTCASASTSAGRSRRRSPSTWPRARSSAGPWSRPPTPTPDGVAAGVVAAVAEVVRSVGAERVDLVTHSTTQAVNALLEGDVGTVGVLGLGRRPELSKARKRTQLERVELSPGTLPAHAARVPRRHRRPGRGRGARRPGPLPGGRRRPRSASPRPSRPTTPPTSDGSPRWRARPACRPAPRSELTGLYGLELRAVTAALNASILPIADAHRRGRRRRRRRRRHRAPR